MMIVGEGRVVEISSVRRRKVRPGPDVVLNSRPLIVIVVVAGVDIAASHELKRVSKAIPTSQKTNAKNKRKQKAEQMELSNRNVVYPNSKSS